ncbi:MAG: extracellular solute-binding protein, partial [Actinomycetota bacterium]|nr:extracellular solute-binding protein [Actinomycetota bacterium]
MLVLVALTVSACGSSQNADAPSRDVRLLVFGDPEELKAYRGLIASFARVAPEIRVKLVAASDREDLLARLATSFAGGDPPDLFLLNYRFYGQFAAKDVLEPIESRVEGSSVFREDDFFPQALAAFRFRGKLTCLPQNVSSLVVYYNKDLFRRARIAAPTNGWTWAEMITRAQALTQPPDVYGLGVEPSIVRLAPFVWSAGGELVDDVEHPTRLTLD